MLLGNLVIQVLCAVVDEGKNEDEEGEEGTPLYGLENAPRFSHLVQEINFIASFELIRITILSRS